MAGQASREIGVKKRAFTALFFIGLINVRS